MSAALLEVRGLTTWFETRRGIARAVNGVNLSLAAGQALALVGESGSGKSVTASSILRLVAPPGRIVAGEVLLEGTDLLTLSAAQMRAVRGRRVAMIFQDPSTALNPVQTIGAQIVEAIRLHRDVSASTARTLALDLLDRVQIPAPQQRFGDYPHRLSGGMRQRAMIAIAIACEPALLIADEPTTALDVTTQAQILDLLRRLQSSMGLGILLITHDLGVVAELADTVAVMYAGRIVEHGPAMSVFEAPRHPYTAGLLACQNNDDAVLRRLMEIPGTVPSLLDLPTGCAFAPRCRHAVAACRAGVPIMGTGDHAAACLFANTEHMATH